MGFSHRLSARLLRNQRVISCARHPAMQHALVTHRFGGGKCAGHHFHELTPWLDGGLIVAGGHHEQGARHLLRKLWHRLCVGMALQLAEPGRWVEPHPGTEAPQGTGLDQNVAPKAEPEGQEGHCMLRLQRIHQALDLRAHLAPAEAVPDAVHHHGQAQRQPRLWQSTVGVVRRNWVTVEEIRKTHQAARDRSCHVIANPPVAPGEDPEDISESENHSGGVLLAHHVAV